MPTLVEGDLRLRPALLPDDVTAAVPWYHDPEVLLNSEGPAAEPYDAARVEGMYRYLQSIGELYIIEMCDPAALWRPIGDVTLAPHTMPIVIGDAACRGLGIGRRVLALLVDRARVLGWQQLRAKQIYTYNRRSRHLFEGAGFRVVSTWRGEDGIECWTLQCDLT